LKLGIFFKSKVSKSQSPMLCTWIKVNFNSWFNHVNKCH
jgi:hypothetical protein